MPVSGHIVFTDQENVKHVLADLRAFDEVQVGEPQDGGVPISTDTKTLDEEKDLVDKLRKIPNVLDVTLVYHNFEDTLD